MRMVNIDTNTRIIDLTVGQLIELLNAQSATMQMPIEKRRLAYGIAGIAQVFNCSIATANRIKKSGRIDEAIKQHGRVIIVDIDLALELFNNSNK